MKRRAGRSKTLLFAGHALDSDGSFGGQRGGNVAAHGSSLRRGPRSADFFEDPHVSVGELAATSSSSSCNPKCVWECEHSDCNTKCRPSCQAPKCMTACEQPKVSECRQICEDPKCAVICPSGQCERDDCPGCHTVCGEPRCRLDCGRGRFCRSTCADPVCSWVCEPGECQEPRCSMRCETSSSCNLTPAGPTLHEVYAGRDENALDAAVGHAVEFAGREVAWQGLAKVQAGSLLRGPLGPASPLPPGSALRFPTAQPMPVAKPADRACASFCSQGDPVPPTTPCECKIEATAEIRIPEVPC